MLDQETLPGTTTDTTYLEHDGLAVGQAGDASPRGRRGMVVEARRGNVAAWKQLVGRYAGMLRAVARAEGLSEADAADVAQTTWMRLVEHIGRIYEPEGVGAWLATTMRRECVRLQRRVARETPIVIEDMPSQTVDETADVDERLEAERRRRILRDALATLPPRQQELMRALATTPDPSYQSLGDALNMPHGSIGPTRGRALRQLRVVLRETGLTSCN